MSNIHVKNEFAAFLHGELSEDAAFRVATHLSQCAECQAEFEEIKLGDDLAKNLRLDVPSDNVWTNIEEQLAGKDAPVSTQGKKRFLGTLQGWPQVYYVMVAMLIIMAGLWWYQTKVPRQTANMNFDEYLTMLESQPGESFPAPFAALPEMFGKVDSVTAHETVGLKEVGLEMTSLGYQLYANRLRQTQAGSLAQFVYGNDNEVIAVFVIPKSVKCDFGRRRIESAQLGEISYAHVASQNVSTLWLGNDRHQFVFVTYNADAASLTSVLRLFVE